MPDLVLVWLIGGIAIVGCGRSELGSEPAQATTIPDCTPGSPEVVYSFEHESRLVGTTLADEASAYVLLESDPTDGNDTISLKRVSKSDRSKHELAKMFGARELVSYADSLLTSSGSELVRIPKDGGAVESIAKVPLIGMGSSRIGVDGARIVVLVGGKEPELVVFDTPDAPPRHLLVPKQNQPVLAKLRVHDGSAYVLRNTLDRVSLETGNVETLVPDATSWRDFVVNAHGRYWLDSPWPPAGSVEAATTSVYWRPDGTSDDILLATSAGVGERLVLDEAHVYWKAKVYDDMGIAGRVFRAPLVGGSTLALPLAASLDAVLAQDPRCLYLSWRSSLVRYSK